MSEPVNQEGTDERGNELANQSGAPSIHIAIDAKGNIILETVGTTGNQCDLLTGALEANLGLVISRTNKDCYDKE